MLGSLLPHPPLILSEVRPVDIGLLVAAGMLWELVSRGILWTLRKKSASLIRKEVAYEVHMQKTDTMRKQGPSAFVETSKLERVGLTMEKELTNIKEERKAALERMEKILGRFGNMGLAAIIFVLYYGAPVLTMQVAGDDFDTTDSQQQSLKSMLFPLTYWGVGMRIARWGLEDAQNSMGALVVFWSGQVLVSKLFDAADAWVM